MTGVGAGAGDAARPCAVIIRFRDSRGGTGENRAVVMAAARGVQVIARGAGWRHAAVPGVTIARGTVRAFGSESMNGGTGTAPRLARRGRALDDFLIHVRERGGGRPTGLSRAASDHAADPASGT